MKLFKLRASAPPAPETVEPTVEPAESSGPLVIMDDPVTTDGRVHPVSDEGIAFAWMTTDLIVNMASEFYDAHRRELHINGQTFAHVSETLEGHWVYRHDT